MRLKIFQIGEPILRQIAKPFTKEEIHSATIQQLIEFMKTTMYEAPGVGLAAPQIGQSLQLIVIEDRVEYHKLLTPEQMAERERKPVPFHVIINPIITYKKAETVEFIEGCLSVGGFVGLVPRALEVTVECLNEKAEATVIHARGWYARILQHEIDHLHGTLCIDHMNTRSLMTFENYTRYWKDKSTPEIKKLLKIKQDNY